MFWINFNRQEKEKIMTDFKVVKLNEFPHYEVFGLSQKLAKQSKDFFELYLAKGFSTRTIRAYAFDLIIFFRFFKGHRKTIPEFKNITIKNLVDFIHQERSRNAATSSINRRLNTVDLFYRHCYNQLIPGTQAPDGDVHHMRDKRYLTADSTLGIFPIYAKKGKTFKVRAPQKLITALEQDELELFFKTLNSLRDQAIVSLMLICGLRSSEVLSLKITNINSVQKTLRFFGKGNKERIVPLNDQVLDLIQRYLELERPVRRKSLPIEFLFLTQKGPRRGEPMTLEGLRSVFRYKRAASGILHANPHRFRHTFGRNMAMAGISLPVLQKILGHADHRTTLKYINLTLNDVHADFEKAQKNLTALYEAALSEANR